MEMEVFAWADEQRERNSQAFYRLLEQGRQTWTPAHIFNRCCVKWLVDGKDRGDVGYGFYDEYSPRNGCPSRQRCNRDHPMITLRFDVEANSTTATLSHQLDPFVSYFDGLVAEGKALRISPDVYKLVGYLRPNETALRSHNGFGRHLIEVEQGSMEASDAAQSDELEGRVKKRPRSDGGDEGDAKPSARSPTNFDNEDEEWTEEDFEAIDQAVVNHSTTSSSPCRAHMLEEVMNIVMNERLHLDLQNDPLSLFGMRLVCKSFENMAMSIASKKLKTLDLSITPLINGKQQYGDSMMDGYDTESCEINAYGGYGESDIVKYQKKEKMSLSFQEPGEGETEGAYYPIAADATFSWDSGWLDRDAEEDEDDDHENADYAEYAYCGQLIRGFWHPSQGDPVKPRERVDFFDMTKPSLGIQLFGFNLHQNPNVGNVSKSVGHVAINYEVIESNTSKKVEEEEADDQSDEESEESEDDQRRRTRYIKYSGKIRLVKVKVDFGLLVQAHACKVKKDLRRKHSAILRERPLTRTEKEYEQLVAAASGIRQNGATVSMPAISSYV